MIPKILKNLRRSRQAPKEIQPRPLEEAMRVVRGESGRELGIANVLKHADEVWITEALAAVFAVAKQRENFTADHVWLYGEGLSKPREPRAMGAVMRIAAKARWIEPTDTHWLSKRPSCHRRPLRVWRSLLK